MIFKVFKIGYLPRHVLIKMMISNRTGWILRGVYQSFTQTHGDFVGGF